MFTGLVQQVGRLAALSRRGGGAVVSVDCAPWNDGTPALGESVAVQGCCLTVCALREGGFEADVLDETLRATALSALRPGAALNLERALRPCDRLGGHVVQGHVDATARLVSSEPAGRDAVFRLECEPEAAKYVVYKGSVALDGVSLTVSAVPSPGTFEVNVIPTTLRETSLRERRPGDLLNLETDILGRYVEAFVRAGAAQERPPLTVSFLERAGFSPAATGRTAK